MIDVRHIRHFLAVAEHLHFGRAAAALNLAQPALTRSIQRLEELIGATLLERTTRKVSLTRAGLSLAKEGRSILEHVAATEHIVRATAHDSRATVSLGIIASLIDDRIADTIACFATRFPSVDLQIEVSRTEESARKVADGRFDAALILPIGDDLSAFRQHSIAALEFVLAVPADHRLAHAREARLAELQGERFLIVSHALRPERRHAFELACIAAGFHPDIVMESPRHSMNIDLVARGMGVSVMPRLTHHATPNDVVLVPLRDLPEFYRNEVVLIWREGELSAAARALVDLFVGSAE